jgi:hypothetical protein
MHFEILVEDASGKIALEGFLEKILGPQGEAHSYRIKGYKGVGRIPRGLTGKVEARKRILLDRLPNLLRGYGNVPGFELGGASALVVVLDLDSGDCKALKGSLLDLLAQCHPAPRTLFRIAIEEMEAWILGDLDAIRAAYPKSRRAVLERYRQDSICGTWEVLADAIHPGGAKKLKELGWPHSGIAKCAWARQIAPRMDVESNRSPSFQTFREGIRKLAEEG